MSTDNLLKSGTNALWHPCTQMHDHEAYPPIPIRRGRGVWLEVVSGKRYLDGISSWFVKLFGHSNPRINAAITAQLEQLEHVILARFTHARVVQLSEPLVALPPPGLAAYFSASDG